MATGVREAGATVDISASRKTAARGGGQGGALQAGPAAPVAKIDDLANYGTNHRCGPTRFGRMAAQMTAFLDQAAASGRKARSTARWLGLHLDRQPTWQPGNEPVLDHHQLYSISAW